MTEWHNGIVEPH